MNLSDIFQYKDLGEYIHEFFLIELGNVFAELGHALTD